jgi:hypothetical protein
MPFVPAAFVQFEIIGCDGPITLIPEWFGSTDSYHCMSVLAECERSFACCRVFIPTSMLSSLCQKHQPSGITLDAKFNKPVSR